MERITKKAGVFILTLLVCVQASAQKEKGDSIRTRQIDWGLRFKFWIG